jgi:hypothetical protein
MNHGGTERTEIHGVDSTTIQPLFNNRSTKIKFFCREGAKAQRMNHGGTESTEIHGVDSTTIQPLFNNRSTTIQHPFNQNKVFFAAKARRHKE